ncbi:fam-j protein [Plasmodium relictum]|uniref:Fam-j protein n=1 Tax=Plasmodium relictum TaxID=85471 RepID=A0A1J1GK84_PLARL|nr:fam-j protein [Plasmodium relictum]CRG84706.1 fam-j protein [Plasmodium relictum]
MHTRENSPSMRNFIDAVNIEQDEIFDSENTLSHFPVEEKNSDSDNEDYHFNTNLVDIINLEKSKSCDIANILDEVQCSLMDSLIDPFYPSYEKDYLTINTEAESSSISLVGTKNVEYEDSIDLKNTLDEASNILPDLLEEPLDLPLEPNYSTTHTEAESSSISLISRKNVENEDSVEIQNILNELLNTLPDSQIQSIDLPLELNYSTVHNETESSRISLIKTKIVENEDSCNLPNIFSDSYVTSNYLERGFFELPLGGHSSTIRNDSIPSSTNNLMFSESESEKSIELQNNFFNPPIEQQDLSFYIEGGSSNIDKLMHVVFEKPIELENILPNFSINQPTATISDFQEDTSLVNTIEQASEECMGNERNKEEINEQILGENTFSKQNFFNDSSAIDSSMHISSGNTQSCKKKGKKRNYEDIDNLDNQSIGNYVCINPKKKYTYNKDGENLVCSLLNVFDIETKFMSRNVVPNLQKLRDILNDDKKDTHNDIVKKVKISILSLRDIINEEIQKINHSDLTVIKNYYDKNIEGNQLVKSINNSILSFRRTMNHRFNKKEEIYEGVDHSLKILHDSIYEYKFFQDLYHINSIIINNSMHSKLFSAPFIHSFETFKNIFELFRLMDELIKIVEKSIKNGFLLRDRNYFRTAQKMIFNLCVPITSNIRKNLVKLDDILKILNLSYEDYNIIVQTIFHFFKENVKNKKKLRHDINKLYRKNSFRAVCDFLLEEEKHILWYYNEASEIFNLNLSDKNKEGISFNDLINNENTVSHLSSLYKTLTKLIGTLFIKKQLIIISKICKSLLHMNSLKRRKHISHETRQIIKKEYQSNLLSQIESEKCRMEKVKFNIRNLYLFVSVKEDIKHIQVSNDLKNKIKEIISILRFLHTITCKDDITKFNHQKKGNTENILLALYYAYQRLIKFTENEI